MGNRELASGGIHGHHTALQFITLGGGRVRASWERNQNQQSDEKTGTRAHTGFILRELRYFGLVTK